MLRHKHSYLTVQAESTKVKKINCEFYCNKTNILVDSLSETMLSSLCANESDQIIVSSQPFAFTDSIDSNCLINMENNSITFDIDECEPRIEVSFMGRRM